MGCETWTEKFDAYLDGELPAAGARALGEHLRGCAACAADSLSRVQQKRAIQAAGQRFTPSTGLSRPDSDERRGTRLPPLEPALVPCPGVRDGVADCERNFS